MINYREEEKRILDEILGKGVYDNRIRPSGTNGTGMKNVAISVVRVKLSAMIPLSSQNMSLDIIN